MFRVTCCCPDELLRNPVVRVLGFEFSLFYRISVAVVLGRGCKTAVLFFSCLSCPCKRDALSCSGLWVVGCFCKAKSIWPCIILAYIRDLATTNLCDLSVIFCDLSVFLQSQSMTRSHQRLQDGAVWKMGLSEIQRPKHQLWRRRWRRIMNDSTQTILNKKT